MHGAEVLQLVHLSQSAHVCSTHTGLTVQRGYRPEFGARYRYDGRLRMHNHTMMSYLLLGVGRYAPLATSPLVLSYRAVPYGMPLLQRILMLNISHTCFQPPVPLLLSDGGAHSPSRPGARAGGSPGPGAGWRRRRGISSSSNSSGSEEGASWRRQGLLVCWEGYGGSGAVRSPRSPRDAWEAGGGGCA